MPSEGRETRWFRVVVLLLAFFVALVTGFNVAAYLRLRRDPSYRGSRGWLNLMLVINILLLIASIAVGVWTIIRMAEPTGGGCDDAPSRTTKERIDITTRQVDDGFAPRFRAQPSTHQSSNQSTQKGRMDPAPRISESSQTLPTTRAGSDGGFALHRSARTSDAPIPSRVSHEPPTSTQVGSSPLRRAMAASRPIPDAPFGTERWILD